MINSFLTRFYEQWRSSFRLKLAGFYVVLILLLTLLAPVLFPALDPNNLDLVHPYLSPFTDTAAGHWLGTDRLGRDVLANLIFGFRTGFKIGLPVICFALLLGTLAGSLAAWFGNRDFKLSRAAIFCLLLLPFPGYFYGFYRRQPFWINAEGGGWLGMFSELAKSAGWLGLVLLLGYLLFRILNTLGFFRKKVAVPLDEIVLKVMELLSAVPRLVLILSLAALLAPGIGNVVLLLCLTYWAGPARLVRAEALKIKQLPFMEAGRASGLTQARLLFRHLLPNASGPLITAFTFGLGSLIALEATLSFLGIGLPPETPSLGRLLAAYRNNLEAWWLVVFPAVLLFFLIISLQIIGISAQKSLKKVG